MYAKLVSMINRRLWVLFLLLGFILLVGNACTKNVVDESIDNPNTILSEHQWVLSTVSYRGEDKDVEALTPTYFQFDTERNLLLITTPCEGSDDFGIGFEIVFQDEQGYILNPQEMITVGCGELIEAQLEHLRVLDTTQYKIQDKQLILTGENIQIVLESDDANP